MAKQGVNTVILVGNLGQDPEVRYMPNGSTVTNITMATSESWTDKNSGQKEERTEWHRVCFFGKVAEIAGEYLKKGSKCYIQGSLRTRKWQDQSGNDRYTTEIIASDMQMLDSRSDNASSAVPQRPSQQSPAPKQAAGNPPPGCVLTPKAKNQSYAELIQKGWSDEGLIEKGLMERRAPQPTQGFDDFDDDVPF